MRPVRIIATLVVVAALAVTGCASRSADQTAAPASSAPSSAPTTQPTTTAATARTTAGTAGTTTATVASPTKATCALSRPGTGRGSGHPVLSRVRSSEPVQVTFGAEVLAAAKATGGGEVVASFAVPSGFAGSHYPGRKDTFQAKGRQSGTVASATFTVTG